MAYPTYTIAEAVTPSDTVVNQYKALYVGTGGNVSVNLLGGGTGSGNAVIFSNVPNGTLLPVHTYRVNATGNMGGISTDASGIIGLF